MNYFPATFELRFRKNEYQNYHNRDGSWATALAYVLSQNGHKVTWHIRTPEIYESLKVNGINCDYLRFLHFSENKPAITQSSPSRCRIGLYFDRHSVRIHGRSLLMNCRNIFKDKYVISAVKGIIPDLNVTPCNYLRKRFGINVQNLAFLSVLRMPKKLAQEKFTYLTVFQRKRPVCPRSRIHGKPVP